MITYDPREGAVRFIPEMSPPDAPGRLSSAELKGLVLKLLQESSPMIEVRRTADGDPLVFAVVVRDGKGETRHSVTMSQQACARLAAGAGAPEQLVEAAFGFLLDREPKEAILSHFDITVISRYFPEFERELPRYLAKS
jgi:hypothetical protein